MTIPALLALLVLVCTHLFVHRLQRAHLPRSKWLSFAGGASVSYIFIQILPELQHYHQAARQNEHLQELPLIDHSIYFAALLGLTTFYGLEHIARRSQQSQRSQDESPKENIEIFWTHIAFFAVYNLIIGYLLARREEESLSSLAFFTIAMGLHMVVTDYSLDDHYEKAYQRRGRWIIVTALLLGGLIGFGQELPAAYIGLVFAFITGAIIMNILKEELPEERKSNFWAFSLGVVVYSLLLMVGQV